MLVGLSGGGHGGIRSAPPPVRSPCAYTTAQFLDYVNFLTFAIRGFRMPRLSNSPTIRRAKFRAPQPPMSSPRRTILHLTTRQSCVKLYTYSIGGSHDQSGAD